MYNLSNDNPDRLCPNCRRVMVDLARYGQTEDIGGGIDTSDLSGWGPRESPEVFFVFAVFDALFEAIGAAIRRVRLRRICRRELSENPRSLICPACLTLIRRR